MLDSAVLITERKGVHKQEGRMEETRLWENKKCGHEKSDMISLSGVILEIFMTSTNN